MSHTMSLFLAFAFVGVLGYLLVMRVFFTDSRALDLTIDHGKMREWKDDDEWK